MTGTAAGTGATTGRSGKSRRRTADDLFHPEPGGWGLRGDPLLWREMRAVLAGRALPESPDELRALLRWCFKELTGHRLDATDRTLSVAAYRRPGGGMSSGLVSPAFWRDTAMPLIEKRYLEEDRSHGHD